MDSGHSANPPGIVPDLDYSEPPAGSDRRTFMMRSALATAILALGGRANPLFAQAAATPPLGAAPVDPATTKLPALEPAE